MRHGGSGGRPLETFLNFVFFFKTFRLFFLRAVVDYFHDHDDYGDNLSG